MNYFQTMNRRKIKYNYQKTEQKVDKVNTRDCVIPLENAVK